MAIKQIPPKSAFERFTVEQGARADHIRRAMKERAKVPPKTAENLARNVGRILQRVKSGSKISMSDLVRESGLDSDGQTAVLHNYRINPDHEPKPTTLRRLARTPSKYLRLIEALAKLAGEDADRLVTELAAGTLFSAEGDETAQHVPYRIVTEIIRNKVELISRRLDLPEYFRASEAIGAVYNGETWSMNFSGDSVVRNLPRVRLCDVTRERKPGLLKLGDQEEKPAEIGLVERLYLAIGHRPRSADVEPMLITVPFTCISRKDIDLWWWEYEEIGLPASNPGRNAFRNKVNDQELIYELIEKLNTDSFQAEDTYDSYRLHGLTKPIESGGAPQLWNSTLQPLDSSLALKYFRLYGHNYKGLVQNTDNVVTEARPHTILSSIEANLHHFSKMCRDIDELQGTETEKELGGNFLVQLENRAEKLASSFREWIEDQLYEARELNRSMLNELTEGLSETNNATNSG